MTAPQRRSTAVGALAALLLLLVAAPTPAAAVRQLRESGSATDVTAPLVAALALAAWLLAGWLLLTVVLTLLARVPGTVGTAAARVVRRVAPVAVRRLVGTALGVSVVAGTLGATPASAAPVLPAASSPAAVASPEGPAATSLDRPGTPDATPAAPPALDWPAPAPDAPVRATPTSAGEAADAVVVQPGDTLWGLAEQQLAQQQAEPPTDRQVAAAWPGWWAANRDVVGDDPDLLHPGTTLQPPDDGAAPDPT